MTSDVDIDAVVRMAQDVMEAIEGEDIADAISAISCVITEILSSHATSKDEALILLNTAIMTISVNMEQRMRSSECAWQNAKQ